MRGGAGGRRSPRDGRGWGRVAGERYRDKRGTTRGTEGAEREKTEDTVTTVMASGGRIQTTVDPPEHSKDVGAGGKYRAGGRGMEDSADESAEWSREETEEEASEEESETGGGAGEAVRPLMATGRELEDSGE